jgi:K+-sensing histidine kinase KdpD
MRVRNVALALLGAAILVLKPAYHGPGEVAVQSYAGNVAVAFALYFAAINTTARLRRPRLLAALATLVAVEAFEIFDGFGVMANVVDPVDLVANLVGIALAVAVDVLTARGRRRARADDAPGRSRPTPP